MSLPLVGWYDDVYLVQHKVSIDGHFDRLCISLHVNTVYSCSAGLFKVTDTLEQ